MPYPDTKQPSRRWLGFAVVAAGLTALPVVAKERRAEPPKFDPDQVDGIFFDRLSDGFRGGRPSISTLRKAGAVPMRSAQAARAGAGAPGPAEPASGWAKLISAIAIEDEVKRVKLEFDKTVSTPGAFRGGGYQDARRHLSVLSMLFAIVNDYGADVRWRDQAAGARDLIARTAFNCKTGSTQVYNEAKLRKADLQDLVSGGGINAREAEKKNDWSMVVDRSPLMEYSEFLLDELEGVTNRAASIKPEKEKVLRIAELFAVLGEVLVQEGLDDYDDDDYASLSRSMSEAGIRVREALEKGDDAAVQAAVSEISQSCANCHEQYR